MSDADSTSSSPSNNDEGSGKPRREQQISNAARWLWDSLLRVKKFLFALASALLGGLAVLIIVGIIYLNGRPDLKPWHEVELDEEFTRRSEVKDFAGYLDLEDRLFEEVYEKVFTSESPEDGINRYLEGNPADPRQQGVVDGNRTFELKPNSGNVGSSVLLLHGMSDSPYSLLRLGESLHAQGAHVIGLRLPGHGTAPAQLTKLDWRDMHAATILAVDHLAKANPEVPLHLIGYSNGGGLAIHYAIKSLDDEQLATPDGIILISPAIGVSPMARIAVWQGRLGRLFGLEKLAWNSIRPEYDPFKYNSFAINAGHQVHRLTMEIDRDLAKMAGRKELQEFPPVVAFQSVVDATVSAPALIENLFSRLPRRKQTQQHELVLFDINRETLVDNLIAGDPTSQVADLLVGRAHNFAITVFSNRDAPSDPPTATTWQDGAVSGPPEAPAIRWPAGLYSLSHISLPFSPEDQLYGDLPPSAGKDGEPYRIGNVVLRGERGLLETPAADQLRLRWNPFYPWLENRVLDFVSGESIQLK